MAFQGARSVVRLPQLALQYLGNHRTALSFSCVERVPAIHNVSQSQEYSDTVSKYNVMTLVLRRTYAQRAVSRPKAHTGRTTTAARKAPTTSKTKAAKKPAPKKKTPKAVPKAKSKAKPRIKPKPKPAKKKKAKPKPKPRVKKPKVLTEAQKTALTKKKLKATALKPPRQLASTTWTVFFKEKMAAANARSGPARVAQVSKEASVEFKQLTPERLEHYNHLANQNKAANATTYRQWVESHTPETIWEANVARRRLKRLGETYYQLHDDRQVLSYRTPYIFFVKQRTQSGDFRGLKTTETMKLIGREWRGLQANEKKPFIDLAAQDFTRYTQERKTVLNRDVQSRRSTA